MEFTSGLMMIMTLLLASALAVVLRITLRGREAKRIAGEGGMIGLRGRAETAIAPRGMAFVRGELWHACSRARIAQGEAVRVVGHDRLAIIVEADKDQATSPKGKKQLE